SLRDDAGPHVRAGLRLVVLDDEVEHGRIDVALLGQDRLEGAHPELRLGELGAVLMVVVVVWAHGLIYCPKMRVVIWLALLLGGNLLLVAGLFLTRLTWRPDVESFGRGSPILQIMTHPERFATQERLREIRLINLLGGALLCGAVVILAYEIVSVMRGV